MRRIPILVFELLNLDPTFARFSIPPKWAEPAVSNHERKKQGNSLHESCILSSREVLISCRFAAAQLTREETFFCSIWTICVHNDNMTAFCSWQNRSFTRRCEKRQNRNRERARSLSQIWSLALSNGSNCHWRRYWVSYERNPAESSSDKPVRSFMKKSCGSLTVDTVPRSKVCTRARGKTESFQSDIWIIVSYFIFFFNLYYSVYEKTLTRNIAFSIAACR